MSMNAPSASSIGKKRVLSAPLSAIEALGDGKCCLCEENACIQAYTRYFCLLHYSTSEYVVEYSLSEKKENSKNSNSNKNSHIKIVDEIECERQNMKMQDLWRNAIVDVVSQMYEYQEHEQDEIRKNPFSEVTLNAAKFECPTLPFEKLKELFPLSGRTAPSSTLSPKKSAISKSKPSSLWIVNSTASNESGEEDDEDKDAADNVLCDKCGSSNTRELFSTGMQDISRSEVWGSKNPTQTFQFICNNCGYEYKS